MSIRNLAPGFELTTSRLWVSSLNHMTKASASASYSFALNVLGHETNVKSFYIWYRNSLKADRPIVERLSERFSVEALKQEQEALTRVEWKEIVPSNDAVLKIGKWWVGKLVKRTPHRSSLVEGDDGLYLPDCQSNLGIVLYCLYCLVF